MAFNEQVILTAGTTGAAKEISVLDLKFEVNRDRLFKANNAKVRIFNVSPDTTNNILKKGSSFILEAGYADEGVGVIYIGQITSSTPGHNGFDNWVDIESNSLQGKDFDLEAQTISLSYADNTMVSGPIEDIAAVMGLATYGLEDISDIKMKNGYVFAGTPKAALRYCLNIIKKEGFLIFIDNQSLIVSSEANPNEVSITDLREGSGLLEAAPLNSTKDKGKKDEKKLENKITFKSILNHKISPNKFIDVDNDRDIKGRYIVDKCTFTGANFGTTPFVVKGEAIGAT